MIDGIDVKVSNRIRKVLEFSGESQYKTGSTTIEAKSSPDGKVVMLYLQNKGFGLASSKSVKTELDNDTAAYLLAFLQRHLELSEKAEAARNAAGQIQQAEA